MTTNAPPLTDPREWIGKPSWHAGDTPGTKRYLFALIEKREKFCSK